LVVGIGEDFTCVSSDLPSILPLTRKIIRIQDGEIITLWANKVELHSVKDGSLIAREPELVTETMEAVQKGGYPHFMLKEVHEQPQVGREVLHMLAESKDVETILGSIRKARNVYFIGCGTSYHACLAGSVYFAQLAGRTAIPVVAPQFVPQYLPTVGREDVGIFVSQSGETKDVLNALSSARERGMTCYGMANVIGSTLTKTTAAWLPLCCGYEISVPATKTFTNQVITFLYLATRLGGKDTGKLDSIPGLMEQTLKQTAPQIQAITEDVNKWNDLYCLGYGATFPMALEGALKLKEITYAHCEGMLSTEFKHGPLSAVTQGFPVLFAAGPQDVPLIVSGINEVTCRGGRAIVIGEENASLRANASDLITLPQASPAVSSLLSVLPLQLLSYHMSVGRGYDPDFPRNLSKTLTVD
jgi:glucosamine--fructose-6-phosphate aminotransferase (isomerizing)